MDMRLDKGFKIHERYSLHLVADFFNVTNRANLWSNPDVSATINYAPYCTPRTPGGGQGPIGYSCTPLTAWPQRGVKGPSSVYYGYGAIDQIAPGSSPFAFQAGVRFTF
jgi:hypothetical protein